MGLKIYSSTIEEVSNFSANIQNLLENIPSDRVCGVVVCGVNCTIEYHQLLGCLKTSICKSLGKRVPVTLIPQYLLPNGGLSIDIYTLEDDTEILIKESDGVCYGVIDNGGQSMLFIEAIPASDFTQSVKNQSQEVFDKLDAILTKHGFAIDDIVRQWNYIGNIVSHKDGKQNYQQFNDARTHYYQKGVWQNGYPAATGIGTQCEGIIVGGIALKSCNKGVYPIDNPLQIAAHSYSKSVLIDNAEDALKSTPKFERAKLIETQKGACCFVSGTAAIRGEKSIHTTSAKLQTSMTIENIDYLVSPENLVRYGCKPYSLHFVQLQVFIKNKEDYDEVKSVVEKAYPQLPIVYTVADVCRSELLVEIEGILIS